MIDFYIMLSILQIPQHIFRITSIAKWLECCTWNRRSLLLSSIQPKMLSFVVTIRAFPLFCLCLYCLFVVVYIECGIVSCDAIVILRTRKAGFCTSENNRYFYFRLDLSALVLLYLPPVLFDMGNWLLWIFFAAICVKSNSEEYILVKLSTRLLLLSNSSRNQVNPLKLPQSSWSDLGFPILQVFKICDVFYKCLLTLLTYISR